MFLRYAYPETSAQWTETARGIMAIGVGIFLVGAFLILLIQVWTHTAEMALSGGSS